MRMLTPTEQIELLRSPAQFSDCREYRYTLYREIPEHVGPPVLFVMLNPSTADELRMDPTVTRCCGFARALTASAMYVCNLFALRATRPADMIEHAAPVDLPGSSRNDTAIKYLASHVRLRGGRVICAWGNHGTHRGRAGAVLRMLRDMPLCYLELNQSGQPKHPLYIAGNVRPQFWNEGDRPE